MDQLHFMFANDYKVDDDNNAKNDCNKKEAKIKNEPEDDVVEEEDDSYIMPESLLQQITTTQGKDAEGEDDNTIFNFGIETSANKRPTPTIASKPSSAKNPQDAFINFDLAVMYICPACGSEFDTQTAWKTHINGIHEYNTRRGLNFVPIDKLYHRCLECNKPIAMHAMENLLKHKFTHLPHRCTKCRICHRLYKYRQDLIVHLRLCHREDVIEMMGDTNKVEKNIYENLRTYVPPRKNPKLEIRDIKGNAIDIFENTNDSVEVKNEPFDADDQEDEVMQDRNKPKFHQTSILEDALSRKTSQVSGHPQQAHERQWEKHIEYICPVCNSEFNLKNDWRDHLQEMHNFFSFDGLGLEKRSNSTVECLECKMVLPSYSIEPLQIHKFSHLPCKTYMRCKLCLRSFHIYKGIIKHFMKQHRLEKEFNADADESQDGRSFDPYSVSSTVDFDDDQVPADEQGKFDCRDIYETQIDYLCPKCGEEFFERKLWRNHIVQAHNYTDLKTLCFEAVNEHQLQCHLCGKVITNAYGVQNAQQHYFTHLPHKAYIRCRICTKSYTDRKGLVKHLRKVHHISSKTMSPLSKPAETKSHSSASFQKSTPFKAPRKAPVKEIVRHNGVIYEIQFLDEDSNDDTFMDDTSTSIEAKNDYSFTKPPKRHVCPDCYSTFGTAQELQRHIREQHDFKKPIQSHVCTRCYCTFESEGALYDHKLKHHSNNSDNLENNEANDDDDLLLVPSRNENVKVSSSTGSTNIEQYFCYMCPACGEEFKSQYEWRRHINDIHYFDRRYELNFKQIDKFHFECLECKEIVNSPKLKALQDHKFRHLPYKLYIKCRLCSTCYNHKPNVVTHLRIRHNLMDPREILNNSPSVSPSPSQMAENYEKESTSPSQLFNIRSMTTEDIISNHNAVDHESITYRCPQCNDPFDTHALWRQHIVTAHDLNSRQGLNFRQLDAHHYICLECYKRVTVTHTKGAIGQLQSHKFRHLPYKSFSCTTCDGVFVRKQMFFKHLNRITNRCPLLGNVGVHNYNPKIKASHLNVSRKMAGHGGSTPAKNLNFSVTSNERCPYIIQCPQCGIKFERWAPWRDHIEKEHALHSMESLKFRRITDHLHICLQCKERVTGANFVNLQTHRFKHLPYGTYLHCRYCDVRYYYMINIIKHMKQKHPNHGLKELELQLEKTPVKEPIDSPSADLCMELNEEKNNDNIADDEDDAEKIGLEHEKKGTSEDMIGSDSESQKCSFIIYCPQCGVENDNWPAWREHIAAVHSFDKLDALNFTKIKDWVFECNECKEQVNFNSLYTLQIHKFTHLPYSSYLQCRYCDEKLDNVMDIMKHLKSKHPEHVIQKHDKPIELDDVLSYDDDDDDIDEDEGEGEGTKDNLDIEGGVDDDDEEEDDEIDDDDDDDDEDNDNTVGDNAVRMDVDDFEDAEDEDEEDVDDDDDVGDDEDNEDDDGGSENFDNTDTEVGPTGDSENTNTEVPRGAVEDIEEVEESEQFVLG
uniref:Zinc finger protein 836 n=1 Tax=Ceratitis capitata TaxID=7213 RepID=W8BT28_CERCA